MGPLSGSEADLSKENLVDLLGLRQFYDWHVNQALPVGYENYLEGTVFSGSIDHEQCSLKEMLGAPSSSREISMKKIEDIVCSIREGALSGTAPNPMALRGDLFFGRSRR